MADFDPIGLIEKSYGVHQHPEAWLAALASDLIPHLSRAWSAGVAYFFDPHPSVEGGPEGRVLPTGVVPVLPAESRLDTDFLPEYIRNAYGSFASPEIIRRAVHAMRTPGIESFVDVIGDIPRASIEAAPFPVCDSAALVVNTGTRTAIFCNMGPAKVHLNEPTRRLWRSIAVHLGAGCRVAGRAASTSAPDVEAVIEPGGQVIHATGEGKIRASRALLRAATMDIDRARTRAGRSDPHAALELWRGLLAGRWSLVDHFDSDGRRFVLARRNDPDIVEPAALTRRERQVAFYASLAWSNEDIGYALGLSSSTVGVHLRQVLTKLGLGSREELVRVSTDLILAAMQHG